MVQDIFVAELIKTKGKKFEKTVLENIVN